MQTKFRVTKAHLRDFFAAALTHLDSTASQADLFQSRLTPLEDALQAFVSGDLGAMGKAIDYLHFPPDPTES